MFNSETNMSPSMTETIETQTNLKFSTSQMQTELDIHTAETQAEITVQSSEVQTEVEVITSETQTEVELPAAETQTEWDVNTSQTQTESTVQTADVQTELPDDKIVQTEVNNSNILTVNRMEVVSEMLSWGTQTDLEELASMTPIYPSNDDDTDSILSFASKHHEHDDVASKSAIKPAGLDMRRGEYCDVDFPPVSTLNVPMKPLMEHAIRKERTPSPVDLCTTPKSPVKKKFKSAEKLPAACTVSEDPHDVLRYVHKSSKESLKIAQAHQPPPSPSVTSKPRDMTKSLIEEEAWKSAEITKDDTSMLFRRRYGMSGHVSAAIPTLNAPLAVRSPEYGSSVIQPAKGSFIFGASAFPKYQDDGPASTGYRNVFKQLQSHMGIRGKRRSEDDASLNM